MARVQDRQKAIELRKQGKTYSEIKQELHIPKSTLSNWLTQYPLSEETLKILSSKIKEKKYIAIERTRLTKSKKRQNRHQEVQRKESEELLPFTPKELYLCGLFLYWGEGLKALNGVVSLNNTDPLVIKFYYHWLVEALHIPKDKIRVFVHLYKDMDIEKSLQFWSDYLTISRQQFDKPYIKESTRTGIDHKGGFGHGTCGLRVYGSRLKEKIIFGLQGIAQYYSEKSI